MSSPVPEPLEHYLPALEELAACLRGIQRDLNAAGAPQRQRGRLSREVRALRLELSRVQRLAAEGACFYAGWTRLVGAFASGYSRSGDPAPLAPVPSLTVDV